MTTYAARYYAQYKPSASGPSPVIGWFDMAIYGSDAALPPVTELFALTETQFASRTNGFYAIENGEFISYVPSIAPVAAVPLKTQAESAQAWIQQKANLASAMGEVFTADMKAYALAVNAIASGADTTSTVLPAQPVDVMETSAT